VTLSGETTGSARYRADVPAQEVFLEFETTNGVVTGVVLDRGPAQGRMRLQRLQAGGVSR
jgi:hypothetical protein